MKRTVRLPDTRTLAAYLEGEVSRSEAEAVEKAAAGCAAVKDELDVLCRIRGSLGTVDDEVARRDLVPGLRQELVRTLGQRPEPRPRPFRLRLALSFLAGGGLVAAVAVVVGFLLPRSAEFRAKGGGLVDEDAWVGLHALRSVSTAPPVRVEGEVAAGDALRFAYSNVAPRPFSHLMIFAIDDRGEVYWYHPAYERAGGDPGSLSIEARADVELREAIRHPLRPGALALYAVFTREPLRVGAVEAVVVALTRSSGWSAATSGRLPFAGSAQKVIHLKVTP